MLAVARREIPEVRTEMLLGDAPSPYGTKGGNVWRARGLVYVERARSCEGRVLVTRLQCWGGRLILPNTCLPRVAAGGMARVPAAEEAGCALHAPLETHEYLV